jgi:hypothetical protein
MSYGDDMTRTEILRDLVTAGRSYDASRLEAIATELDRPLADVLVVAGHPVPGHLLPPTRDQKTMEAFTYRVTFCNHPQLATLREFLLALPAVGVAPEPWPARDSPDPDPFAAIMRGFMHNRGFDVWSFPFVVLSHSTIRGMLRGSWHSLDQLHKVAGPLGWSMEDLAVLAGEPVRPIEYDPLFCRHVGAVFEAAVPCTSEQLVRAAGVADQLSAREDHGIWQPVSEGVRDCPDPIRG